MNKSLALKNKLYLFLSLFFSFSIFLYLVYFLINGERGVISYKKIKNQKIDYRLQLDELKNRIPLGRLGEAGDIAGTALLLCSAHASYITGEIIEINGGLLMN